MLQSTDNPVAASEHSTPLTIIEANSGYQYKLFSTTSKLVNRDYQTTVDTILNAMSFMGIIDAERKLGAINL